MPHVLFRVNAGKKVGMGHLARCMSIARRIADFSAVSFMVSTDSRISVETFIRQHSAGFNIERLLFIGTLNMGEEIELLVRFLYENSAYLVLDHYDVNEEYQLCLKKQGVHWFQLDSHARQIFMPIMSITEVLELRKNYIEICRGNKYGVFIGNPLYHCR